MNSNQVNDKGKKSLIDKNRKFTGQTHEIINSIHTASKEWVRAYPEEMKTEKTKESSLHYKLKGSHNFRLTLNEVLTMMAIEFAVKTNDKDLQTGILEMVYSCIDSDKGTSSHSAHVIQTVFINQDVVVLLISNILAVNDDEEDISMLQELIEYSVMYTNATDPSKVEHANLHSDEETKIDQANRNLDRSVSKHPNGLYKGPLESSVKPINEGESETSNEPTLKHDYGSNEWADNKMEQKTIPEDSKNNSSSSNFNSNSSFKKAKS